MTIKDWPTMKPTDEEVAQVAAQRIHLMYLNGACTEFRLKAEKIILEALRAASNFRQS